MRSVLLKNKQKLKLLVMTQIMFLVVMALVVPIATYQKYKPEGNNNINIFSEANTAPINEINFLKEGVVDEFETKLKELLLEKYPTFVVQELLKENVIRKYDFYEEYIYIEFTNFVHEDKLGMLNIKLYASEIKEFISYELNETSEYQRENGYNYDPNKKSIALTFDDGPHATYTNDILDLLEDYKMSATFFMLGLQIEKYPSVVKEVYNSPNEVANHSYSHQNFKRINDNEIKYELTKTNGLLKSITGEENKLFRPPYGAFNEEIEKNNDYSFVLWDVDTNDWQEKNPDVLVNRVLSNIQDGSIVLFHDIFAPSVEAIEKLLPLLYLEGYQVMNVTELSELKNIPLVQKNNYRYLR